MIRRCSTWTGRSFHQASAFHGNEAELAPAIEASNFARHGNPNGPGLPAWPRYERTQQPIMLFDRDVIPAGPDPERAARHLLISIVGEQPEF